MISLSLSLIYTTVRLRDLFPSFAVFGNLCVFDPKRKGLYQEFPPHFSSFQREVLELLEFTFSVVLK